MLITHDMGVIAETADRVAVMYAGRIAEIGPVAEVIRAPKHPYTVGLMGSIPSLVGEREHLVQIDGAMPRLNAIPPGCAFHPRCPNVFRSLPARAARAAATRRASRAACWLYADSTGARIMSRPARRPAAGRAREQDVRRVAAVADADAGPASRGSCCAQSMTSASTSGAARRWDWWANPAAASRRSRA